MTSFWEGISRLAGKVPLVKLDISANGTSVLDNTWRVWRGLLVRQFTVISYP